MDKSRSRGNRFVRFFTDKARWYRYAAMIIITVMCLGGYMCGDSVGSLQEPVMQYLELSASNFSLIYSISAWPNIVLCLFGGYLVDRIFGVQRGAVIYCIVMCFGQILFALGVLLGEYWLVLLGRLVFGVGVEMLFICVQCYAVIWFKGKELSMVFCLMVSTGRIGTFIMYEMATPLYATLKHQVEGKQAVGIVFFVAALMASVSVGVACIIKSMNPQKYEKIYDIDETLTTEIQSGRKENISFKDILHFPLSYWLIVISFSVFVTCIYGLIPLSQGFFMTHYGLPIESANNVTSFFSILGAVLGPFIGILVDRIGRTIYFQILAMSLNLIAHVILTFASTSPYVGMFLMSISFGLLVSSTTPLLSFIIPEHQLGTAFGVNMSIMNIAFSVNVYVAGTLVDNYNFTAVELYFIAWNILGVLVAITLWFQNRREKGVLNMSTSQRRYLAEEKTRDDETKSPLKA